MAARCCARPASARSRCGRGPGRDRAGGGGRRAGDHKRHPETKSVERSGASGPRRDAALERCIAGGGVAVFPADGLYGLACDPLNAAAIERIHRIKGRDDGKPSAVLYFSPLAMRELVESFGERTAGSRRRPAARPGHAGRRQPRAPLSACLPRGPRAAGRAPDRRAAGRRDVPDLPDLGQPQRRARACPLRRRVRARSSPAADLAIDGGALAGLPSTVVDLSAFERAASGRCCARAGCRSGTSTSPLGRELTVLVD